ncbi:MAG: adenylate/guanylate cyclase domain-containing protein [Kiritimatiellae bacterium]|nr:adenylate/guanylate cyclase domain-containing protein [Kiritimatiellia bacterium]
MNYDALTAAYWRVQSERVGALRQKISARPKIGDGRVVPDDGDLAVGDGRRLDMAVMFLDISKFSARPMETVEEQDLMLRVLNLFFTEMIRIAEEYGGNVEKNTGDGLMVYFNDGEGDPAESGVKRAVAAALTMMKANNELISPILRATPVQEIRFRVSIDYGQVSIARLGAPRRFNANVAIGTTANFASKMLKHAEPGDIVLGASARQQLPMQWQNDWTQLLPVETGWVYRMSGAAYQLYRYTGRWSRLV